MKKKEWKQLCKNIERLNNRLYVQYMNSITEKHIQLCDMADEVEQLRDAAEFEARVAAKLTDVDYSGYGTLCETCTFDGENCIESYKAKYHHECTSKWAILKRARIDVEEEMDG